MPESDTNSTLAEHVIEERLDRDIERVRMRLRQSIRDPRPDLSGDEVMERLTGAANAFDTREKTSG